ncbi:NAD(P)H-hydrate dehydratase [Peptoniphilus catoniae]|uniref:NAD(P)H-hydrate dehydratase n=1 Tax=Peptoniphilus catoniae TaxID=1660341 RepID=UPI0010FE03BD|nr:NAD(P)H-hydrate dehydratase [Peptoniphilus catoniae]
MIGIDIISISKVDKLYKKYGFKFIDKLFTKEEKEILKRKNFRPKSIAGMFAAKEAISKAMGTGIGKLSFKDIKIYYINSSPYGKALGINYNLSISHDKDLAVAIALESSPKFLHRRNPDTHKGDYGKVGILAGSRGMTGSAYLATMAALRMGSGLVYNLVPKDIFNIMSIKYIEPIVKTYDDLDSDFLSKLDSLAVGMGIGRTEEAKKILFSLLRLNKKILIDADGLNLISKDPSVLKDREVYTTVLTPHLMEFSRLCGKTIEEINENKEEIAREFARDYKVVLLLKGHRSLVTYDKGFYKNKTGNAGMATAGSGDVLSGIIASLLARGYSAFEAACAGAYIHGLAGDIASENLGEDFMLARDIVKSLKYVLGPIDLSSPNSFSSLKL